MIHMFSWLGAALGDDWVEQLPDMWVMEAAAMGVNV